ncbi:MAG: hypothetical protein JWN68_3246 [Nocardioides sp.]|jgi:hypothetical protein|nr:hypothetical protein [Nocardioides sp.]
MAHTPNHPGQPERAAVHHIDCFDQRPRPEELGSYPGARGPAGLGSANRVTRNLVLSIVRP